MVMGRIVVRRIAFLQRCGDKIAFVRLNKDVLSCKKKHQHILLPHLYVVEICKYVLFDVSVERRKVFGDKLSFHNHGDRNFGFWRIYINVGRRKRAVLRFLKHAHVAVGFQYRVFDFGGIETACAAQSLHDVVDVEVEFFHDIGQYIAVLDDDNGFSVEKFAESDAFCGKFSDDDMHQKQRKDGDYAVQYRD